MLKLELLLIPGQVYQAQRENILKQMMGRFCVIVSSSVWLRRLSLNQNAKLNFFATFSFLEEAKLNISPTFWLIKEAKC